jgi:N-acetylglucosaminyldiphosphoundecaprenol N-acetyl-beta-D-mannosaminyltransferase
MDAKAHQQLDYDFSRNVWCVLGLPFDALNMDQAINVLVLACAEGRRCFMSTPNLNYLVASQTDALFRQSVINSDLSVVDGLPLVLVAKLLNVPLPERIAGSSLCEQLYARPSDAPLRVFFFGGESGVGEQACQAINQAGSGLTAVGSLCPGFGSVDDMSTPDMLSAINTHAIDLLVVSISAKKGQYWIEANKDKLNANVISHLGAVINFFAGTVKRAPQWMQLFGFEWCWRIYQEPSLWKRYFHDGSAFLGLLWRDVLPYWLWQRRHLIDADQSALLNIVSDYNPVQNRVTVSLLGECDVRTVKQINAEFKTLAQTNQSVVIDLAAVTVVDSAFFGQCLLLCKYVLVAGRSLSFVNANPAVRQVFVWNKMDGLLTTPN